MGDETRVGPAGESEPRRSERGREKPAPAHGQGLCSRCQHVKIVASSRGSQFLLCRLSGEDPRFPKYPPQPVVSCAGFRS